IKLADTSFKILNTDTNQYVSQYVGGKVLDTFKTDETGKTQTYLKLEAGNYKIVEIKTPKGYLINKEGVNFSIGDESNYKYTSYGLIVTVDFVDQAIKGQIEINKKGEKAVIENNTIKYEEIPLNKVKFEIRASEDILSSDKTVLYYEKGALVDTITTNADGYAISKKLPLGKYYVIEVQTGDKYILDSTKHEIELKEIDNQTPIVYESISKMNYLKKGSLEFTKTDLSTDEPLPNTLIEVYTENDELIFSGRTDENGKIVIKDIVVGKYYILEKEAPEGYTLNEEKMVFEILENGEVIKSTMKDKKITGSLDFTKLDFSTDETLPNTLIQIYNENDELVFEGRTDENGKIIIDELTYGKYYILEKEAPEGYELNTEKMWFEIREDGEIIKSIMKDHKIIQVPITDATDYKELIFSAITLIIAGIGFIVLSKKKNKGDSDEKK
ncbi:MAG TPA: SpaA isopeptide-forming pilin-related protein, partial [Bacilli bacterium]|nr:SpaA isopeptide-forming pilin-related protein [Bacilli bacterium]